MYTMQILPLFSKVASLFTFSLVNVFFMQPFKLRTSRKYTPLGKLFSAGIGVRAKPCGELRAGDRRPPFFLPSARTYIHTPIPLSCRKPSS